jgi:hypothetical protein
VTSAHSAPARRDPGATATTATLVRSIGAIPAVSVEAGPSRVMTPTAARSTAVTRRPAASIQPSTATTVMLVRSTAATVLSAACTVRIRPVPRRNGRVTARRPASVGLAPRSPRSSDRAACAASIHPLACASVAIARTPRGRTQGPTRSPRHRCRRALFGVPAGRS